MHRRRFLAASLAASAAAFTRNAMASAPDPGEGTSQEFYQIRRYALTSGSGSKLTETYLSEAMIPGLQRLGLGPVGAFRLEFGPETPQLFLLIPGTSVQTLAEVDLRLADDAEFMKAAAPFWNAPAGSPAFNRIEVSLLKAFTGWPRVVPPTGLADHDKRIFQLRTYESPSQQDHVRKVEMFNSGEFDFFRKAHCNPVFFADTLIGTRMPSLTYMLSFSSMDDLNAGWNLFNNDPDWKKLSSNPRYAFEPIVSNITNEVLQPLKASQI